MARKSAKIKEIQEAFKPYFSIIEQITDVEALRSMRESFNGIEDKRFKPYVEHKLPDIVMIGLVAVISGANEWTEIGIFAIKKEDWLKQFLELPNGIPSHDTIQRVISAINGNMLYCLSVNFLILRVNALSDMAWALRRSNEGQTAQAEEVYRPILPVDGKTSRGSRRNKTDRDAQKAMHTVSVYSTEYGFCLAEKAVEEKTNTISAVYDLLEVINVQGAIVTWDALNTQKETVKKVICQKGEYVGALKANQHDLYEDVKLYFEDEQILNELRLYDEGLGKRHFSTVDKEQSGVSVREHYISSDIKWIAGHKEWAGFNAIGMVICRQEKLSGEKEECRRYFITSLTEVEEFGLRKYSASLM